MSGQDAGDLIAIAAALLGALLAGVIAWAGGRSIEGRRQRNQLLAAALAEWYSALTQSADPEQHSRALLLATQAKLRLVTFGPRGFVEALLEFDRAGSTFATPRGKEALLTVIRRGRKLIGAEGRVSDAEVLELLGLH